MCVLVEAPRVSLLPAKPLSAQAVLELLSLEPGLIAKLDVGANFLQPACGREATTLRELAKRFPRSTFAGTEISEVDVAHAQRRGRDDALQNFWLLPAKRTARAWGPIFDLVFLPDASNTGTDSLEILTAARAQLTQGGILVLQVQGLAEKNHTNLPGRLREAGFSYVRSASLPIESDSFAFIARR